MSPYPYGMVSLRLSTKPELYPTMDEREKGVWRFKHHVVIVQLDTHATPIASELRTGVKFIWFTQKKNNILLFIAFFQILALPFPFPLVHPPLDPL